MSCSCAVVRDNLKAIETRNGSGRSLGSCLALIKRSKANKNERFKTYHSAETVAQIAIA